MNILLLTDGIAPIVMGGMQKHSRLIAEYLSLAGNDVVVYHYSQHPVSEKEVRSHFSDTANQLLQFRHFVYQDTGKIPGHYLRAQKAMSKQYLDQYLSDKIEYDFIYTKGFMGWSMLEQCDTLGIKTPIGVKFHGMNMFQKQANFKSNLQKYLLRPAVRMLMNKSDVVFSYGGKITQIIKNETETEVMEISSGIAEDWISDIPSSGSDGVKFLFVGRYDRVKGLPELYSAINNMKSSVSNVEFHFVGPIPANDQLSLNNCFYHGSISNEIQLKSIYDRCDVLLNTSISEGMPNVILEAMARGLAILATDVGATSILVSDKYNGLLLKDANPDVILEAIFKVLDLDKEGLALLKRNSLNRVKDFTWEKIVDRTQEKLRRFVTLKRI